MPQKLIERRLINRSSTSPHRGVTQMRKPKILVVEDNPVIRQIVLINLGKYFVEIDTAHNGIEAIDKFQHTHYDLVFMDVAMPGMDGLTATEEIRKFENGLTERVPIVGLTASANMEDCLKAGMDDYETKPPDYERMIKRWLPELTSQTMDSLHSG